VTGAVLDPEAPLVASGNLRRRMIFSRVFEGGATGAAFLAVAVLGIVVFGVASRGAKAISIDFLTKAPPRFGGAGGGIAPAIVGTALIAAVATLIAMPFAILVAVYVTEFASQRPARVIRLALDLLNGLPTIVVGLFVFGLLVVGHHQSGFAGSVALAIIMLPLIARASQGVLLQVPQGLRDAADALGVSRFRTVLTVVLPAALGGILTGTVLALARAAGETAPLILVCSIAANNTSVDFFGNALPNIPVQIFTLSQDADPASTSRGWGAALVLLTFIMLANIGARFALARSRRKLGQ
jgi:phosphate transport system permease protein